MPQQQLGAKKRSKAQKEQLAVVHTKHAEAETLEPSVDSLKSSLASVQEKLVATKSALSNASSNLEIAQDQLHAAKGKCADLYSTLRVERRKLQRTAARKGLLEQQIKILKSVELPSSRGDAARAIQLLNETKSEKMHLESRLSQLMEKCALEASHSKQKQSVLKEQLVIVKKKTQILQKHCDHMPEIKAKAIKRAKDYANKENRTYKMIQKGAYSPQSRELACTLVAAGCSREYVGKVIKAVCKNAGVTVHGSMSRRTVSRAILEGGIAAQIQIGHEIAQADGKYPAVKHNRILMIHVILAFTVSEDGTSNKHVAYDSHHINLKVPSYTDDGAKPAHENRLLGITSSPNQTAEGQAEDTVEKLGDALEMYNKSPLAKHFKQYVRVVKAISLLRGVNTDHCTKAKKYADVMEGKMIDATRQLLGEEQVLDKSWEEIENLFDDAWDKMVSKLGGIAAWDKLSRDEQALQHAIMIKKTLISLGEEKYAGLPEEDKKELDFFIWVGCRLLPSHLEIVGWGIVREGAHY